MQQRFITLFSIFTPLIALSACGGGDPDTRNSTGATAVVSASDAAQTPEAQASPMPGPTPAPLVSLDPDVLSNALPQAGSSTAIGNGVEGLWVAPSGVSAGFAFVGPDGGYIGFLAAASTYPVVFEGGLTLAATHWSFTPASHWSISDGTRVYRTPLSGSGDVMLRYRFQGSYTTGDAPGSSRRFVYDYAAANALAASQADLVGDWSTAEVFLSVDVRGNLTGYTQGDILGHCLLEGSVRHLEPGTHKNMFAVTLIAAPRRAAAGQTACRMDSAPLQGYTALTPDADVLMTRRDGLTLLARNGTRFFAAEFDKDLSSAMVR